MDDDRGAGARDASYERCAAGSAVTDASVSSSVPPPGPGAFPEGSPAPSPSSDAGVDRALGRLQELDERPLSEHVAVFEDVHRSLHDALSQAAGEGAEDRRG
jgi:hypothetical protein